MIIFHKIKTYKEILQAREKIVEGIDNWRIDCNIK